MDLKTDQPARGGMVALVLVAASVFFNFALSLVNTHLFRTTEAVVVLSEALIIGAAAIMIARFRAVTANPLPWLLIAYFMALLAVRGEVDLKFARDMAIPLIFFWLGQFYGIPERLDRFIIAVTIVLLVIVTVEMAFVDIYTQFVGVLDYYIARGTLIDGASYYSMDLANNAFRPRDEPRQLLPFLGSHRGSGAFLEPLSAANFGAIAAAWMLARQNSRPAVLALLPLPLSLVILADGRFGMGIVILCAFFLLLRLHRLRLAVALLPVGAAAVTLMMGVLYDFSGLPNTLVGRLWYSGQKLLSFDLATALGLVVLPVSHDSGLAYMISRMGLPGLTLLWGVFVLLRMPSEEARRFHFFVGLYLAALLTISVSSFSLKTAALLWFCLGTLAAARRHAPAARAAGVANARAPGTPVPSKPLTTPSMWRAP